MDVPAGSPSRGGDVAVHVFDINQSSFATPFYSVLVSISVLMALSTVLHSIHSLDNFLPSHSVLPVLFPLYSTIYFFMKVSFSPDIILCGWLGLKHQLTNYLIMYCLNELNYHFAKPLTNFLLRADKILCSCLIFDTSICTWGQG